jgi:hypothetical protein
MADAKVQLKEIYPIPEAAKKESLDKRQRRL